MPHKTNIQSKRYWLLLAAPLLLLISCGGGGGSGGSNTDNSNPTGGGTTQPVSTDINPGLPGRFLFEDFSTNSMWLMDAATGRYTRIPNSGKFNWAASGAQFGTAGTFLVSADNRNPSEFLIRTVDSCATQVGKSEQCVAFQGYDGNFTGDFIIGSAKIAVLGTNSAFSWDHQHVAVFSRFDILQGGDQDFLEIFTRTGQQVDSRVLDSTGIAWLPDDRIIYQGKGDTSEQFIITKPLSTEPEFSLTPTSDIRTFGNVGFPSIDPSGTQVAFLMRVLKTDGSGEFELSPWVMSLDGTGLRQLANAHDGFGDFNAAPQWSPDGRWIAIRTEELNTSPGLLPVFGSNLGVGYAFPSQDQGVIYNLSPDPAKLSPQAIRLRTFFRVTDTNSETRLREDAAQYGIWVP